MKKYLGVGLICLLAIAGCGGDSDDGPPKLEGPATLTSVWECLEDSDVFTKVVNDQRSATADDPYSNGFRGVYAFVGDLSDSDKTQTASVRFFPSPTLAEENIQDVTALADEGYGTEVIDYAKGSTSILVRYEPTMPDEAIDALRRCSSEDY